MTRATPMALDERRRAIIEATVPLLLEHGTALSTRRIAQAACVAEGTIFRAFDTLQDLINETILNALAVDRPVALLGAIEPDRPLADVVADLITVLQAEIGRTRALTSLLTHPPLTDGGPRCPAIDPHQRRAVLRAAVADVLRSHAGSLAVDLDTAASVLMAMAFATTHEFAGTANLATPHDIADVVLHGLARGDS